VKKVLALVVSFCVCCVCFDGSYIMASEGQFGVFFATRDLEGLKWLKRFPCDAEGYGGEFVTVNNEDTSLHMPFRHCFLVFGRQLAKTTDELLIEVFAAIGVSRVQRGENVTKVMEVGDETEWLFDLKERSKFTISCTPFVLEGMPLVKRNGSTVLATEDNVMEIWNRCYVAFNNRTKRVKEGLPEGRHVLNLVAEHGLLEVEDEAGNGYCYNAEEYDGVWNNCCTVAFESLRQVAKENDEFDLNPNLSHINKRSYNVCGVSIPLSSSDDSILTKPREFFRLCHEIALNIVKWKINKEDNVAQLEEYHNSLKDIENYVVQAILQRYKPPYGKIETEGEASQIIRRIHAKKFFAEAQLYRGKLNISCFDALLIVGIDACIGYALCKLIYLGYSHPCIAGTLMGLCISLKIYNHIKNYLPSKKKDARSGDL
jgi:hypothetical protein